jgi:hypothetical protein
VRNLHFGRITAKDAKDACEHYYNVCLSPSGRFNCLSSDHVFRENEFDQVGLTDFSEGLMGPVDVDELKTFIVFIDMHS